MHGLKVKQIRSEITLEKIPFFCFVCSIQQLIIVHFFSLGESSQDPFTYCVLGLIRVLVKKRLVPVDAWEFILCGIVSLIQVLCD